MNYGTTKTTKATDLNNSTATNIEQYAEGQVVKNYIHYQLRIKVESAKDEMSEFIRFSDKLRKLRQDKRLYYDQQDTATHPAFRIDNKHGTNHYFVVLNWAEKN